MNSHFNQEVNQEASIQAELWRQSLSKKMFQSKSDPNFWIREGLNPRYIQVQELGILLKILDIHVRHWEPLFQAGLSLEILHPNGHSFAKELQSNPLTIMISNLILELKHTESFDLLKLFKEHGLNLNAKFNQAPFYHELVLHHWSLRDMSLLENGLNRLQELGFRLDLRTQKGNTILHEAISRNNFMLLQALVSQDISRFQWTNSKHKTAVELFQKKMQDKPENIHIIKNLTMFYPDLIVWAQKSQLAKTIPNGQHPFSKKNSNRI